MLSETPLALLCSPLICALFGYYPLEKERKKKKVVKENKNNMGILSPTGAPPLVEMCLLLISLCVPSALASPRDCGGAMEACLTRCRGDFVCGDRCLMMYGDCNYLWDKGCHPPGGSCGPADYLRCCPGTACNGTTCSQACGGYGAPCFRDSQCCNTLFCYEGICM